MSVWGAAADLFLGAQCVHCEAPGRLLCIACVDQMVAEPFVVEPSRTGRVQVIAATNYEGITRDVIVAMKERSLHGLITPLSDLLVHSLAQLVSRTEGPVVVVPIPSRASVVRTRGFDATRETAERAARVISHSDRPMVVVPALRLKRYVQDQSVLTAAEREANLAGAMEVSLRALRQVSRQFGSATVVACDDVLTTGATAREAVRALRAVDISVAGIGTIAATVRRT